MVALENSKKPETSDRRNCIAPRTPVVCIEIAVRVFWSTTQAYLLYRDTVLVDDGMKTMYKDLVKKNLWIFICRVSMVLKSHFTRSFFI